MTNVNKSGMCSTSDQRSDDNQSDDEDNEDAEICVDEMDDADDTDFLPTQVPTGN